jgi:NAD(P)-dependent dehydrogenase (short-subunit alcohol dehydrogenase family)
LVWSSATIINTLCMPAQIALPDVNSLLDLHGQIALVTGASGGIGSVTARRLADAGASVAVHYHRNAPSADAVVAEITASGGRAMSVAADIGDEASCAAMFAQVTASLGPVDILVNNAADQGVQSLPEMTIDTWNAMMTTNLNGIFLTTRLAARAMIARGVRGAIVNIVSIEGHSPAEGHGHYATSKAGQLMFTRAAALEYGRSGVRVNSVSPGLINKPGLAEARPPGVARWTSAVPLERLGEPEDVADAVLFLASNASRWITGADLLVDGGISTRPTW